MTSFIYTLHKTSAYPLGSSFTDRGIRFSAEIGASTSCGVLLYPENSSAPIKIEFPSWSREGRVCSMEVRFGIKTKDNEYLRGLDGRGLRYLYFIDNEVYPDPYMQDSDGYGAFGEPSSPFSRVSSDDYVPQYSVSPVKFCESIFYMLHVRGYTAHNSSGVKNKGTFDGVIQKLPYIKSLGVTALIFMPVYEFDEVIVAPEMIRSEKSSQSGVNFWGYTDGYYYVPKASFASNNNPVSEMHRLVEAVHESGMEIILQFRFKSGMSIREIVDVLRFWRDRYNIDGFQLVGSYASIDEIMIDPILYGCKILYDEPLNRTDVRYNPEHGHLNIGFMSGIRKFLKGDPNSAPDAAYLLKNSDPVTHPIVFIARQDSMRAIDIVSYNEKHNEANGENGRDGADYNYSWNCGLEGPTRKKQILELRKKQIKNAFALTIMAQGAPLIYGGDEFANTQFGNNNPYNQDNSIGYIKWTKGAFGAELIDFIKSLIRIRRDHPSIMCDHQLTGRDYLSYGYPDVSMHGEELWRADIGSTSHSFGILYYDRYSDEKADRLIYLIFNMHWETQEIALPKLKGGKTWNLSLTSDAENTLDDPSVVHIRPRSFIILETNVR